MKTKQSLKRLQKKNTGGKSQKHRKTIINNHVKCTWNKLPIAMTEIVRSDFKK